MFRALFCCLFIILSPACQAGPIEREFFKGDIPTRMERFEEYPLEQQWRIFLYGNQKIHPPTKSLALPIAKKGYMALEYIILQLRESENEPDFRDALVVF